MSNSFKDIPLKISYDSGVDDILREFYIPVLSKAESYDRIAGFFSSSTLALSARGLEKFISNGGKMRLVTCPQLTSKDVEMIEKSVNNIDDIITENFIKDYSQIEEKFEEDHVKALGWMLANDKLEIKIAIIKENGVVCSKEQIEQKGIMHQKVGILRDGMGNTISFSGSNNESASGWLGNTEEFKVFSDWTGVEAYVEEDKNKFFSFWEDRRKDVEVKKIPQALKEHLIYKSKDFEPNHISAKKYDKKVNKTKKEDLKLFYYQEEAVNNWEKNNRNLLLQMATGCGKTRTAIACMDKALKDTERLLVVVTCPQVTLTSQWRKDISKLNISEHKSIEINGNISKWDVLLKREVSKLSAKRYSNLIIYTTHKLCSKEKFINIINKKDKFISFLIADEVHGMGTKENKKGLLESYNYRIGLSATPQRWFDDYGSKFIENYFGNETFEFSIHDALVNINPLTSKTFLVNYTYDPRFISLTQDEIEEYMRLTNKINKISRYDNESEQYEYLQFIRYQRAKIEKNAENKYEELSKLLDEIGEDISDTIIFVSDKQMDRVLKMLGDKNISATRFTQEQGTSPLEKYGGISERDYIIEKFKKKEYQVLVAIKCLDEGIDIPSAKRAIIMASSTNPREYIQRIGRIIRQAPGKYEAFIHDMIIKPDFYRIKDDSLRNMEEKIFKKEMDRVLEISKNALNNTTIVKMVYKILQEIPR